MKEFLKLIRWQNLLIVALTMVLMRYAVISPLIGKIYVIPVNGSGEAMAMELKFPFYCFLLLIAATVSITAGGYVINDYFDIKADLINRGKVIVGTKIPRRQAMMWHNIFNLIGVAAGFFISWKSGYFWMGMLFVLVSGLLYFYSASYKRQFLVGNIIVAILTAMVPMLVVMFEWPALYRYYKPVVSVMPGLGILFCWVGGFALFAFMTTITREIIKDIEDFEGDKAYGRNTVPVAIGIRASKVVSVMLIIITIIMLYMVWSFFIGDKITLIYVSLAVVLPLLFVIRRVISSRENKSLHNASTVIKLVMFTGILYSLVLMANLAWNLV